MCLSAGDETSTEAEIQELLSLDVDVLADNAEPLQCLWGQCRGRARNGLLINFVLQDD